MLSINREAGEIGSKFLEKVRAPAAEQRDEP
jgi:hypothetical protein